MGRQSEIEACIQGQAVSIQRGTGNFKAFATLDQLLAGVVFNLAKGVLPAGTESRRQRHAVIQSSDFRRTQTEGAAEVVAGLSEDFQCRVPAFFAVAVALVALITEAGERFERRVVPANIDRQFGKGLLSVGVVIALEAITEPVKSHTTFAVAIMTGIGRPETQ
ncbi:hypothetical protein PS624_04615 [Pseudomonas fluorescens]|uniref:Uncharacterized protein n=1 Tax=Pseudomonas fluorescens TaxID=294 RepID=A0A5E6WCB2_PSEFL|nr:hypothetical protein PS624_04615 [Pseudomonas fluorescens]